MELICSQWFNWGCWIRHLYLPISGSGALWKTGKNGCVRKYEEIAMKCFFLNLTQVLQSWSHISFGYVNGTCVILAYQQSEMGRGLLNSLSPCELMATYRRLVSLFLCVITGEPTRIQWTFQNMVIQMTLLKIHKLQNWTRTHECEK